MLVLVLQMLDLLGESGKILGLPGNGQARAVDLCRAARAAAGRAVPALFGAAGDDHHAGRRSTRTAKSMAMKAAGLSAHQVLAPLLLTAAGRRACVSFAFNERVVTRATATLKAWEAVKYGPVPARFAACAPTSICATGPTSCSPPRVERRQAPATGCTASPGTAATPTGMIADQVRSPRAHVRQPGLAAREPACGSTSPSASAASRSARLVVAPRAHARAGRDQQGRSRRADRSGDLSRSIDALMPRGPPHRRAARRSGGTRSPGRCRRC